MEKSLAREQETSPYASTILISPYGAGPSLWPNHTADRLID